MRTYMSRLRSVLPDTAVISQGSGYMLDLDDVGVDVQEFDSLIEAAERMLPDRRSSATTRRSRCGAACRSVSSAMNGGRSPKRRG